MKNYKRKSIKLAKQTIEKMLFENAITENNIEFYNFYSWLCEKNKLDENILIKEIYNKK